MNKQLYVVYEKGNSCTGSRLEITPVKQSDYSKKEWEELRENNRLYTDRDIKKLKKEEKSWSDPLLMVIVYMGIGILVFALVAIIYKLLIL